jgi:hypothetical protein
VGGWIGENFFPDQTGDDNEDVGSDTADCDGEDADSEDAESDCG